MFYVIEDEKIVGKSKVRPLTEFEVLESGDDLLMGSTRDGDVWIAPEITEIEE